MTTVWTAPSDNHGRLVQAWSIRSDLWGPGWCVWHFTSPLADWGHPKGSGRPPEHAAWVPPGALEAMMATGRLEAHPEAVDRDWTEVTP